MIITDWFPDITLVMRMRGFLIRPALKACGHNFQIGRRVTINFPHRLEVGGDVYIATGCWLHAAGGIALEDEVQLGPYAVLITGDHTLTNGSYRHGSGARSPIRLCRGSWVAAHATITKGVTLGCGALVAANGVATHDVPDFAIAAGVPARIIRECPAEEIVGMKGHTELH